MTQSELANPRASDAEPTDVARPSPRRRVDWSILALAALVAVGAWVRWRTIDARGLWIDELITLCGSAGYYSLPNELREDVIETNPIDRSGLADAQPWWWIWSSLRNDSHPPLYLVVLRLWREIFGEGDVAARSLSLAASLAAIVLVFDAGRLLFGRAAGLWSAALMALAAQQVYFAQEVRPYALLVALGAGACAATARLQCRGPGWGRAAALSLCALAMMLSHYFALGALVGLAVFVIATLRGRALTMAIAAFCAAAWIFAMCWLPQLLEQIGNTSYPFLDERANWPRVATLARLTLAPLNMLGAAPRGGWLAVAAAVAGAIVFIAPLPLVRRVPAIRLPLAWILGAVAMPLVLDLARSTTHLAWPRYVILASPGLYLLLGAAAGPWADSPWPWRMAHLIPAVALAVGIFAPTRLIHWNTSDFRGFAQYVQSQTQPGDLLVFPPQKATWLSGYSYAAYRHYGGTADRRVVFITKPMALPSQRKQDVLVIRDLAEFPAELLPGAVPASMRHFHRAVTVWRLKETPTTGPSRAPPPAPSPATAPAS